MLFWIGASGLRSSVREHCEEIGLPPVRLGELPVRVLDRFLGELPLGDVARGAEPLDDLSGRIPEGDRPRERPGQAPVPSQHPVLELEGALVPDDLLRSSPGPVDGPREGCTSGARTGSDGRWSGMKSRPTRERISVQSGLTR